MSPETFEHRTIKEIVLTFLKTHYGTGLEEYPNSGNIHDIFVVTPDKIEIFVENIWTSKKSNFYRDMTILQRSPANVKILIVNPKILNNPSLTREFVKTKISEIKKGVAIADMINGSLILKNSEFVERDFKRIVEGLISEARNTRFHLSTLPTLMERSQLQNSKSPIIQTKEYLKKQ